MIKRYCSELLPFYYCISPINLYSNDIFNKIRIFFSLLMIHLLNCCTYNFARMHLYLKKPKTQPYDIVSVNRFNNLEIVWFHTYCTFYEICFICEIPMDFLKYWNTQMWYVLYCILYKQFVSVKTWLRYVFGHIIHLSFELLKINNYTINGEYFELFKFVI